MKINLVKFTNYFFPLKQIMLFLSLLPFFANSQTVKQSISLALNSTYYNTSFSQSNTLNKVTYLKNNWGIGGALDYNVEYHLIRNVDLALSVEYNLVRAKIYSHDYSAIPEVLTRSLITMQSADVPLMFRLKTGRTNNKGNYCYLSCGMGISWVFYSHHKIENIRYLYNSTKNEKRKKIEKTELISERIFLRNSNNNNFGTFLQLGFGRHFKINKIYCSAELSYTQDINKWIYKTKQLIEPFNIISEYSMRRQSFDLKVSVYINNKSERTQNHNKQ